MRIDKDNDIVSVHTADMFTCCSISTLCARNRHWLSALLLDKSPPFSVSLMLAQLEPAFLLAGLSSALVFDRDDDSLKV